MLNALRILFVLLFATGLLVMWLWNLSQQSANERGGSQRELANLNNQQILLNLSLQQALKQHGFLNSTHDQEAFHSKDLKNAISYIPDNAQASNFIWQDRAGRAFAYAAQGIDQQHYFANSYLVGFEPYKTDQVWQPLVTLALRKTYQFDHHQHGVKWRDLWQNSEQAYYYSHGDCEDHALLLADWLISMGYDARVVIGRVPSGGHAWVVLFDQGQEYVLEATSKRRPNSLRDFKLAKYAPDYQPEYMFNRDAFWANMGPRLTTSYSSDDWQQTSTFTRSLERPKL